MSYGVYKLIHLFSIIIFFSSISALFFLSEKKKSLSIFTGISSFLILLGGMGLVARLDMRAADGWPAWVWAKIALWCVLAIGAPILRKRLPENKKILGFFGMWFFAFLAVIVAVYKDQII